MPDKTETPRRDALEARILKMPVGDRTAALLDAYAELEAELALPKGDEACKGLRNKAARFAACLWGYHNTCPECGGRKREHMPVCAQTYEREFKGPEDTMRVFLLAFEPDLAAAQGA